MDIFTYKFAKSHFSFLFSLFSLKKISVFTLYFLSFSTWAIPQDSGDLQALIYKKVQNLEGLALSTQHSALDNTHPVRAQILPRIETILSSEIAACITKIHADMGDSFTIGKPLIAFDCAMYDAQLEKAKAEFAEAQKILEINRRLDNLKSVSELEMAVSVARLNHAKAELVLRKVQVKKCIIYAPFTGHVVRRKANPFEYVSPGQPLLEIIDNTHPRLQVLVPSQWLKRIKISDRFTVHIDETDKDYTAIITALGARVDSVSQTVEIRAEIEGSHPELLAGMSGTAFFSH